MSGTLLGGLVNAGYLSTAALDKMSDSDLASLETRLEQWRVAVTAELAWRQHQRQQAVQDAARSVV